MTLSPGGFIIPTNCFPQTLTSELIWRGLQFSLSDEKRRYNLKGEFTKNGDGQSGEVL